MSQLPSMPMWWADFFNKTDHLSNEEQWAYAKLMAKTWVRNCQPFPDNDHDLARLLNMGVKRWRKIRPRIEPFFDLSKSTWVQHHLEQVFLEATQRREKIVSSGRLGGIAKSNNFKEMSSSGANAELLPIKTKTNISVLTEQKPTQGRAARLPSDFKIPEEWMAEVALMRAKAGLPATNLEVEADHFVDYWHAKAGKDGCKLDWRATWRNWCRNARGSPTNGKVYQNGANHLNDSGLLDGPTEPPPEIAGWEIRVDRPH